MLKSGSFARGVATSLLAMSLAAPLLLLYLPIEVSHHGRRVRV